MLNKLLELEIELMINDKLFEKRLIDENTYSKVNNKLLSLIKANS